MQETQEFYRCLVSDASSRALRQIRDILADVTLSVLRPSSAGGRPWALTAGTGTTSERTRPPYRRARRLFALCKLGRVPQGLRGLRRSFGVDR